MDVTVLGAYCSTVYTVFETNPSFVSSGISCWNIPQAMRNIHSLLYLLLGWTETKICLASKNRTLEQIRPILSKAQFFCQICYTVISYNKVISCLLTWIETQNLFSQHESQAKWQLSLSWPIQSDNLLIADWMIPPLRREHSHGKTQ